eukprot:3826805-Amphidinium_carterae.1
MTAKRQSPGVCGLYSAMMLFFRWDTKRRSEHLLADCNLPPATSYCIAAKDLLAVLCGVLGCKGESSITTSPSS